MKNKIYNKKLSLPGLTKVSLSGLTRQSLLVAALFTFFSCTNLVESNDTSSSSQDRRTANGETYLVINSTTVKKTTSRSASTGNLAPTKDDVKPENLTNLVVSGRETSSSSSAMKTLATADTLSELQKQKIKIDAGDWTFKLSAEIGGIPFSSNTVTKTIKQGVENTVTFVLTSDLKYGGLEITIEWTNEASKVVATLMDAAQNETIDTKTFETSDIKSNSVTYQRDITKTTEQLASGTYYLEFNFYNQVGTEIYTVGYFDSYVNIADGLITKAKIADLDLNEIYKISYEPNGGELAEGETQPLSYSSKGNSINLPEMTKLGFVFAGWYEDETFTGDSVTSIPAGSTGTKTFFAKWEHPSVYVSGTGDDTTGDGTKENPFASVDKACGYVIDYPNPYADWIIYIMGDVTGKDGKKAGQRTSSSHYARTIIPETLTTEHAKSILLIGYNGLDTEEYPQDKINRGLNGHATNGNEDGVNLVILTSVPVTINNLLIVNANNAYANPSTEAYAFTGGGILVASNATVTLGDGVVIKDNRAKVGGGVYNAGTLFVYGTALIGDRSATQTAGEYNTGNCSNSTSGDGGAGIYNTGKLYLGYSDENTPAVWDTEKGGIIYNNAYWYKAGAIYNALSGEVFFNNGVIKYNSSTFTAGAIYNLGTFYMEGGTIENNKTLSGSQAECGGFFNANRSSQEYGTFVFSGGSIKSNSTSGKGGGIYNAGNLFIYGTAVLGDKDAADLATSAPNCSNYAGGDGGGIYLASTGKCYLGYSSYTDASDNTPETWSGGICYNYSAGNGGGIHLLGDGKVFMNSGTIANNAAAGNGNAVYLSSDNFVFGGTATIPAGNGDVKQTVFVYTNNYSLNINDGLKNVGEKSIALLPLTSDGKYNTYKPIIKLTTAATEAGLTIDDVKDKFTVENFTDPTTGIVTHWTISNEGKVVQNTTEFTVSATGTYKSIAEVVALMNDSTKDYVITLQGEITGPQVIADPEDGKIKANTIKIIGTSNSTPISSIINANLTESSTKASALTINTTVPVFLRQIIIKGGHGNLIGEGTNQRIAGGGLFIGEGATVSFENYSKITENTNYIAGSNISGAGAGVYISKDAKFVVNYKTEVCNNTGTHYGAGIYVADGGYMKTIAGSGSDIYGNGFETNFRDNTDKPVTTKGGGIYLEDGATLEQLGTFIRNNPINENELGSGIYMCSTANYMISGSAQTNAPNDVYLEKDAQIEVVGGLTEKPNVRLTLQHYPTDDEEIYPVRLKQGLSWTNNSYNTSFEFTPSESDGQKNYWILDKTNNGKLTKQTGTSITVTVPTKSINDIEVSVTSGGTTVTDNTHLTGGATLVFTASGIDNLTYVWKLDGEEMDTADTLTLNTSSWKVGLYVVYLEATDGDGNYYSYTAQINITN